MAKIKRTNNQLEKELEKIKKKAKRQEKLYKELEAVEKSLEERDLFLSDVFSSIQDGISILDNNLRILRVNATMEKWYSHAMPVVDKKCHVAYHGNEEPCEICPSQQTIKTGTTSYAALPVLIVC